MNIHIIIINKFGEFKSRPIEVNEEEYEKIIELSRTFYISGYEMDTINGFIVIPPDVIRESILLIELDEK
jgi:hypothetical protein